VPRAVVRRRWRLRPKHDRFVRAFPAARELIDVLRRADLTEIDPGLARAQHHAEQHPVLRPSLFDANAQPFEKGDALLKIVRGERRRKGLCLRTSVECGDFLGLGLGAKTPATLTF
jgi:hypothetical protein